MNRTPIANAIEELEFMVTYHEKCIDAVCLKCVDRHITIGDRVALDNELNAHITSAACYRSAISIVHLAAAGTK